MNFMKLFVNSFILDKNIWLKSINCTFTIGQIRWISHLEVTQSNFWSRSPLVKFKWTGDILKSGELLST